MGLKEVLEKPLELKKDSSVSEAVQLMCDNNSYDAFVYDDGRFLGMLLARDILKKNISDPEKVRIEKFVRSITPMSCDDNVDKIMKRLNSIEGRTIPVNFNGKIYGISKIGLLKMFDTDILKNKNVSEIMIFPYFLRSNDSIATARAMLRDLNISRLPVIDNEKIIGMVDTLDILRAMEMGERRRARAGEVAGEKIDLDKIPVKSFIRYNYIRVDYDTPLSKLINNMIKENLETALVEKNGRLAGIVTIRDIFKIIGENVRDYYVSISGLDIDDEITASMIRKKIDGGLEKIEKKTSIRHFFIHVEKHDKGGVKTRYMVSARLSTSDGTFYANYEDWDIVRSIREVMDRIEREVNERIERMRDKHKTRLIGI